MEKNKTKQNKTRVVTSACGYRLAIMFRTATQLSFWQLTETLSLTHIQLFFPHILLALKPQFRASLKFLTIKNLNSSSSFSLSLSPIHKPSSETLLNFDLSSSRTRSCVLCLGKDHSIFSIYFTSSSVSQSF